MKAIETHQLTKYYGKSRGIIDVDLSVEKGDFFGALAFLFSAKNIEPDNLDKLHIVMSDDSKRIAR